VLGAVALTCCTGALAAAAGGGAVELRSLPLCGAGALAWGAITVGYAYPAQTAGLFSACAGPITAFAAGASARTAFDRGQTIAGLTATAVAGIAIVAGVAGATDWLLEARLARRQGDPSDSRHRVVRRTAHLCAVACYFSAALWAAFGLATVYFAFFLVPLAACWAMAGARVRRGSRGAAILVAGCGAALVWAWTESFLHQEAHYNDPGPWVHGAVTGAYTLAVVATLTAIPQSLPRQWIDWIDGRLHRGHPGSSSMLRPRRLPR
jgi:hypothetical protein